MSDLPTPDEKSEDAGSEESSGPNLTLLYSLLALALVAALAVAALIVFPFYLRR